MIDAARCPWPEVGAALDGGLAILPFGALEAHGPHLPLSTDTLTADAVARAIAERTDGVLLPPIGYGETWNTAGYPGTVSLAAPTVRAIALDIGRAVGAQGAALVIVNGDWGNREPLASAVSALGVEGVRGILLDYPGMDAAADAVQESPRAAPGLALRHAEELETSLVLAVAPELVHREREVAEYPEFPADFGARRMQLHPFSASGVFGDPRPATAAKGWTVLAATVDASVREIEHWRASS